MILSRDEAIKRFGDESNEDDEIENQEQNAESIITSNSEPATRPSVANIQTPRELSLPYKSNPEFHFNIQIHLPSDASPDTYDAIFKSIGRHLLGKEESNDN